MRLHQLMPEPQRQNDLGYTGLTQQQQVPLQQGSAGKFQQALGQLLPLRLLQPHTAARGKNDGAHRTPLQQSVIKQPGAVASRVPTNASTTGRARPAEPRVPASPATMPGPSPAAGWPAERAEDTRLPGHPGSPEWQSRRPGWPGPGSPTGRLHSSSPET